MRVLQEEKRLNIVALLQRRRSKREVSKLLGVWQSKCYMIWRERVPCVELSRKGHPRSITHAQWRACVRTITIGGLNNVVDVRNALSEHLNVVASTNTMRCALHEVGLGSLQKEWGMLLDEEWRISITSSSCESHNKTCRWCNFCGGCMTSHGIGWMHKIEGKTTHALYFSILQDKAMKIFEWYHSTLLFSYFNKIVILNILQN